ncbi:MAG: DNA polymerase III subunit chi [Xanthomonadales bacterium]|nr:DNA polymerase III subunit chi [Gammaproteobacteria bacterium]MBT8052644.1 DNA polymerase III subunit chi [Gammaproteobacteria bacterium]NND56597.1 DNA polymerase III subunit chi [Xanthomonadales bacterium]NNK52461.1 DNA polymerase III subunit chi [Xanthomonadales bacterium]
MNRTCQIDFYVLASPAQSAERLACRLAMMAWEQGHKVAVLTASEKDAAALDEIMWDFPAGRFLPHGTGQENAEAPVSIGTDDKELPTGRDLLINLTDHAIEDPARFTRLLEIVPGAEQKRLASRQKYREYRAVGLEPSSHKIGK